MEDLLFLQKAIEAASDAIGVSDAKGNHFYQNQAFSDLFGYATAGELQAAGGGPALLADPETRQEMFNTIMHGQSWSGEVKMVTKSGRIFTAFERADAIHDREGNLVGLIGIITDISDRKESEQKYRSLVDNSLAGVLRSKVNGEILYVNDTIVEMLEFDSREELIAAGAFMRYKDPAQRDEFVRILRRDGRVKGFEATILTKLGNERVFLYSLSLNGDIIDGTLIDITERKRVEVEITKNQQFLKTITAEVQEVIFSLDAEGIFTFSEGRGLLKLGLQPAQVVGLSAFDVYQEYPEVISSLKEALTGHVVKTKGLRVGNLIFDTTYQPVFDCKGMVTGIVGLAIDVTQAKEAEKALTEHSIRLQALLELNQMAQAPLDRILDFVLEASQKMTGSEISFVGVVESDQITLTVLRWSDKVMEKCKMATGSLEFNVKESGLITECVRTRQPVIINDYTSHVAGKKGIPVGHVAIKRMLAVPALIDGRVDSVITLANKPEEYTSDDALGISALLFKMIEIKRQQEMEAALRESHETLERKVKERTLALTKSKQLLDDTGHLARIGGWELNLADNQQAWTDMVYSIHEVGLDFIPTLESGISFYAPEALPEIAEAVSIAITEGKPWDLELPFITAKQNRLWVRSIGRPIRENGKISRIGGVFQDVTVQKNSHDELKKYRENLEELVKERTLQLETQNTLLEALLNSPGDILIFSLDTQYRYTTFNENHRLEMLKVWNANIKNGTSILECITIPEIRAKAKTSIDRAMSGEYFNEIQHQLLPDIYYEFSWNPIKQSETIIGATVFIRNITERIHDAALMKTKNEQLTKMNSEKDKFFSIIAHDLKSPFNSIVGFSELLVEQMREGEFSRIEKTAEIIQQSSKRALDLLTNLMEWARTQTGGIKFNPEYFDGVMLIRAATRLFEDIAGQKSISIKTELPAGATFFADKAMISTVLRNLISNAIKFTKSGGEIILAIVAMPTEVIISVRDTGVGIPKEKKELLFHIDHSYSTPGTQNEKGTGLGLVLCKEFVEKHGGNIWLESLPGIGTTFYFSIPL